MKKKFDKFTIVIIALLVALTLVVVGLVVRGEQYTEHEFQLTEIQDGVYGISNTVVSSIPAQNYDIITLCCNGQIRVFKGTVHITYTNADPYEIYRNTNLTNADVLYVYVPFGSIEYQGATSVGRR
jgi:hypothetical protein